MRDRYIVDTRIHCCLFFINPTGHGLRPIDVTVMKKLSDVVNVVPVIAKSDSLTMDERDLFKERIRAEMQYNNIRAYPFDNEDYEEEERELNERIRTLIPSPSSVAKSRWSSMASRFEEGRTGMESSMSKTRATANSFT